MNSRGGSKASPSVTKTDPPNPPPIIDNRSKEIESLFKISNILDCGLDRRSIGILFELIESGVHPEALADGK